jgi:pre-rRNA-processing protein TSR1
MVSGFLRGAAMNVNNLVHIPGVGDFQVKQIDKPADPYLVQHKKREEMDLENVIAIRML